MTHSSKRFYTDKEVKLNSLIEKGDNLLFISSADVGRKLEKNLPYEGKIVRVLTDSFEIRDGKNVYTGRTDTNKLVHFKGEGVTVGDWSFVEIEKACPFDLIGKKKEGKK